MNTVSFPAYLLNFLKSLASESRLTIVLLFLDGQERTVNQIAEAVGLGQPTTSEQLSILKQAGVRIFRKEGKEMYFRPNQVKVIQALESLNQLLRSCCD